MNPRPKKRKSKIRCGLIFPVKRVRKVLRKGNYAEKVGTGAAIYLTATLQYLIKEVLSKSVDRATANKKKRIGPRTIIEAIMKDTELLKLWDGVIISERNIQQYFPPRN